ncbi:DUF262 domain-containing protein [Herbaspirillum seropedicae]|uniref:DUF262 domain-containing protein n=1 Tax=Herbaspirillum seropedicae TaxID=964 RepID=UPI003FCCDEB7
MLSNEIETAQRHVRTDAYQMSIGEVVTMYENKEIIIDPEFQRLFRWTAGQKSKLIESILLGIPLPSIFVFETENGDWELIDGLQRLSTLLEFMGKLRQPDGTMAPPSVLEATKYLPSLRNSVWEKSNQIADLGEDDQRPLDRTFHLAIRRARLGVEILKRPSDDSTKYDLFQRLNSGGSQANAQELRNCIMLMVNRDYFRAIKSAAESAVFQEILGISEEQTERQRHMEMAVRFLVHTGLDYDGILDVEEFIDEGIVTLARQQNAIESVSKIPLTFGLLNEALQGNALRRFQGGRHVGRVSLVGLETIAVGIARNLDSILALGAAGGVEFIKEKAQTLWDQPDCAGFNSLGLRGTTRIQRTIPFGTRWFRP